MEAGEDAIVCGFGLVVGNSMLVGGCVGTHGIEKASDVMCSRGAATSRAFDFGAFLGFSSEEEPLPRLDNVSAFLAGFF